MIEMGGMTQVKADVRRVGLVLREGFVLLTAGVTVGMASAAVVAGLLASWLPARKASTANPLDVMRSD